MEIQAVLEQSEIGFQKAFEHILSVEGMVVSLEEHDRGLISKFGITLIAWAEYKKKTVRFDEIRKLTIAEARRFYREVYWEGLGLRRIKSLEMAIAIFDQCVHRGKFGGVELAQRALNMKTTGVMGEDTILALNSVDPQEFIQAFFRQAQRSYLILVQRDLNQMKFLKGWFERTYRILDMFKPIPIEPDNKPLSPITK